MLSQNLLKNLICLECKNDLNFFEDRLVCSQCGKTYFVKNEVLYLIEKPDKGFRELSGDILINKLKIFFKKYPVLFNILYYSFGVSSIGKSAQGAIKGLGEDKVILNLGSGVRKIRKDVINIDFYPFSNIDIVANIRKLPLKDESVDGVICESVLEHMKDPQTAVQEIKRILKPGGLVYFTIPFIVSFHSSPNDYYRWTKEGLRELMRDFEEKEIGIRYGATSALLSIANDWLATVLSFGSKNLQQIFLIILTIITSPLKIFDYLISKFPTAQKIAFGFYFIGIKKPFDSVLKI